MTNNYPSFSDAWWAERTVHDPEDELEAHWLKELALGDTNASDATISIVPLMCTSAFLPPWRHVTGVPRIRPTQALQVWRSSYIEDAVTDPGQTSGYQPSRQRLDAGGAA